MADRAVAPPGAHLKGWARLNGCTHLIHILTCVGMLEEVV